MSKLPRRLSLGVVIVTYHSGREAVDCAASLLASARGEGQDDGLAVRVVIVDNASGDDTVAEVQSWASGEAAYEVPGDVPFKMTPPPVPLTLAEGGPALAAAPEADVVLINSGGSLGFAGGVNIGLKHLAQYEDVDHFWVLNPDSMVPPGTVAALAAGIAANPGYGLMGGRVVYLEDPDRIQIDGGLLNKRTGVTGNYNLGQSHAGSAPPTPAELDFITGASMVASRAFYEAAGPMAEDYFLYYEEVDWAMRRGAMPLAYCPGLLVYHRGGTAIGSPVFGRTASAFSLYFKHRGRVMFQRRHNSGAWMTTQAYSLAQAARQLLRRSPAGAGAILRASFGLGAPASVRARLGPETAARALGTPLGERS